MGTDKIKKKRSDRLLFEISCGGLTRTDDLWVMSPTSYQLLHSAMLIKSAFSCVVYRNVLLLLKLLSNVQYNADDSF